MSPVVAPLVTTKAGLIVIVVVNVVDDVVVKVTGVIASGAGGLTEVLRAISCGFVSVNSNWLYVPGATLAVLRIFVKSTKRAKSTVAGAVGVISGTALPPPCGTRLAELMVAMNDSTSQMGASLPKVATDPGDVVGAESETVPEFDPQPTINAAAKMIAPPAKNTIFLLLILPSSLVDVVSIATLSIRNRKGLFFCHVP
jgi:hypothetical protein